MKKITIANIISGVLFAILFIVSFYFSKKVSAYTIKSYALQISNILCLGISLYCFIPKKKSQIIIQKKRNKLSKKGVLSLILILLLIPLTIYIGIVYLKDRKYYFISLLIILETIIAFFLAFEERKPQARELIIISVLCALGIAGRVAFSAIPQFKPVIALVIISGLFFGGETGFLVGAVTAFVSNFFFVQGAWTPWQMFATGIVGFLSGVLFNAGIIKGTKIGTSIYGFLVTLIIYSLIMNFSSVVMAQEKITIPTILSYIAMGFPLDLIHSTSTAFFMWFGFDAMSEKLERIKTKYGI